ncbi:RagB/SusD family nutrient uptake outer membrane protein [Sediminibacterium roseum]|uniref:RagB/SusD family nutrient uptake outer membrane protein n=1 Tax=Sediminibacterium roseum TaxID=1978412 RepID=A0ABW9ZYW1_9BACT|nr:RagB/SusD family nutrient uptake outer membrane protein [Sediminibacterium roseum]NCI51424.1 RagB/SusD family nutrient uptake outer membrane protein [Sediminibacterium roseum]
MSKRITKLLSLIAVITMINGCTKLQEKILDETSAAGLSDKQVADGLLAPTYAKLEDVFLHTNYFSLQEISTDEAILPYRGGTDWGDNGIYMQLHKHENVSSDANVRNTWNNIFIGLSRAVTAMDGLAKNTDANAKLYYAEARGMAAYYSLLTLDLYGVVFKKADLNKPSEILRGNDAVEYLKAEFLAVEPTLSTVPTVGTGRLTKAAVWGLLARLYLNAAVYRDVYATTFTFSQADMDKVIEYTDKIIALPEHGLVSDYFSLFNDNNHTNKEIIFAVDQRADLAGHNRMAYFSISGDQFPLPAYTGANGTDGPGITSDFYRTWVNANTLDPAQADPRFYKENLSIYSNPADSCVDASAFNINRGILRGQQYGLIRKNGVFSKCVNGKMLVGKLFYDTRSKPTKPVEFTELCDFTTAGSDYNTGFRVSKYEFSKTSVSGRNFGEHDIIILRLADVYLMRAEAKLRKNNDAAAALLDVNKVRTARVNGTIAQTGLGAITLDLLFRERGFELYWEMVRRTDMIRFNKYEGTWTEKTSTDVKKRLFPIPQTAIDAAAATPGYLKQNPSY